MEELSIVIAFRTEGDQKTGLGHIMRCISLALEFRRRGTETFFICDVDQTVEIIERESIEIFLINSNGTNDEEIHMADVLLKKKVTLLIIDSYEVSIDYFKKIESFYDGKIGYIDDLNKFIYPVDVLIHGSILNEVIKYEKYKSDELMLIGLKYNLIRAEFKNISPKIVKKRVSEILLTAGGADPKGMTKKIVSTFLSSEFLQNIRLNVVIGRAFKNEAEIIELSRKCENIVIYKDTSCISKVMIRSDIAITSAGITVYELFATGTPLMAYITSDNQEIYVKKMAQMGYLVDAGKIEEYQDAVFLKKVRKLIDEYETRVKMSNCIQKVLDCKGVERVADKILDYFGSENGTIF